MKTRYIVFEQAMDETGRVNDVFGIFYSWNRANALCKKLQAAHPKMWYGIRELLHGSTWSK